MCFLNVFEVNRAAWTEPFAAHCERHLGLRPEVAGVRLDLPRERRVGVAFTVLGETCDCNSAIGGRFDEKRRLGPSLPEYLALLREAPKAAPFLRELHIARSWSPGASFQVAAAADIAIGDLTGEHLAELAADAALTISYPPPTW